MNLEDRIRVALRTYDPPPAGTGAGAAYERFLVRRRRQTRIMTTLAGIAFVMVLGVAVLVPVVVDDARTTPAVSDDGVVRKPRQGFELALPRRWEVAFDNIDEPGFEDSLRLQPVGRQPPRKGRLPGPSIMLSMQLYAPDSYPGRPAVDPRDTPAELGTVSVLSDDPSDIKAGRRADGQAYFTLRQPSGGRGGTSGGGSLNYVIAWPSYCPTGARCSAAGAYRVLAVSGFAASSEELAALRPVVEVLVQTIRPIGNAVPGGAAPGEEPDLPFSASIAVGTGTTGDLSWTVSAQWHWRRSSMVDTTARPFRSVLATFQLDRGGDRATVDTAGNGGPDPDRRLWVEGQCLGPDSDPRRWVPTLVGMADARAVTVRLEQTGGPPVDVPVFGKDKGFGVGFFVGPALPRQARVPKLLALDAAGRVLGELTRYDGFDRLCTGRRVVN